MLNVDDIRHETWSRNHERGGAAGHGACIACGRDVRDGAEVVMVHLCAGGGVIVGPDDTSHCEDGLACLGYWPIGRDCWRQHRGKLAPLGYKARRKAD